MIASLVLLLHFLGYMSVENAYMSLYFAAALLFIAEIGVVSFGLLSVNAILAFYAAYSLHMGHTTILGLSVGWPLFFGIVFVEILIIVCFIFVFLKLRGIKTTTGTENMIGEKATVLNWDGQKGKVRFEGEDWQANANTDLDLNEGDKVTIESVYKLELTITA